MFEHNHDRGRVHESEPSLRSTPVPTHRASVLACSRRRPRGAGQRARARRRPSRGGGRKGSPITISIEGAYAVVNPDARLPLYKARLAEDEDCD